MLVLEARNIKKYYAQKLVVDLEELKIYSNDRIGIVGLNGAGKTTLMNILANEAEPDEGYVKLYGGLSYIRQQDEACKKAHPDSFAEDEQRRIAGVFGINGETAAYLSGGEKTRLKIVNGLCFNGDVLFADEPTCNLDMTGIRLLEQNLKDYRGAIVLISHDRGLLDALCSRILEVENGRVRIFNGNYSGYREQKEAELERQRFEYEQYVEEKEKLHAAIREVKQRVGKMKKAPSRMGNSEARLHKREVNGKKARLDRAVKVMETRLDRMEERSKPKEDSRTRIDIQSPYAYAGRTVISCKNLNKSFGDKVLFRNVNFDLLRGSKTALIGDNGTGKTTLLNMILAQEEGVWVSGGVKPGYFSQSLDILDEERTILENVMKESAFPEHFVRTVLARLLFRNDDVFKKVRVLSGGEKVKVSFAKVFTKDVNVLIMDEPTNYLDVYSMEALEQVLGEYGGTVLFVSHDRRFIESIADSLIILDNHEAVFYRGSYVKYLEDKADKGNRMNQDTGTVLLILEMRLAEINGRLSSLKAGYDKEALEEEYKSIAEKLKDMER